MVLGLIVGAIGTIVAGVGIYRGSSKIGKAAESTADHTGRALQSISNDLKELKTYLVQEIGPNVSNTLLRFQRLLHQLNVLAIRVEEFVVTGTFATKILALTLLLSAALICKYIASEIERGDARSSAFQTRRSVTFKLETIIVYFLYYICLSLASVLAIHLLTDISQISWPIHFPIIIIIPSIATLSMCFHHVVNILNTIWKLAKQVFYYVFELPIYLHKKTLTSGFTYYSSSSILLSISVAFVILPLYSISFGFFFAAVEHVLKRNVSPMQTVIASYFIFIIIALVVYVIWALFLRTLVRPTWAFTARRNYHGKFIDVK